MGVFKNIRQKFFGESGSFGIPWLNAPGFTQRDVLAYYQGYLYASIEAIVQRVARIELVVNEIQPNGDKVEVQDHPFLKLLDNPMGDGSMSRYELLRHIVTYKILAGEEFIYTPYGERTLEPKALIPLRPDLIVPSIDNTTGRITGYTYQPGKRIPFELDEIWHYKTFNPKNPYRGYGIIEAALPYIQAEGYLSRFLSAFFYNSAKPSGIVSIDGTMKDEDFESLKNQWKQEFGGVNNAGKVGFVRNAEVEFKQIGSNLSDIAVKDLKSMTRDDILAITRVGKMMLGITEDVNRANAEAGQYIFDVNTVDPEMYGLVDALKRLFNRFNPPGTNYELTYKSTIPEDLEAKMRLAEATALTPNERREILGEQPLKEGGNSVYQQMNLMPIGEAEDQPDGKGSKAIGTIRVIRAAGKKKVKPAPAKKHIDSRTKIRGLDFSAEQKEIFRKSLFKSSAAWERKMKSELKKLLKDQYQEVVGKLRDHHGKVYEEYLFDEKDAIDQFAKVFVVLELELAKEQGKAAMAFAGSDADFEITEAIQQKVGARVTKWAQDFNTQTRDYVRDTIGEGIKNGDTIDAMADALKEVYDAAEGYRAERLARTEAISASNSAAVEGYKQVGYVTGKQWYTNPGACEFCDELDGKVISLDDSFASEGTQIQGAEGGSYSVDYEDIDEPPAHPNCECTVLPFTEETGQDTPAEPTNDPAQVGDNQDDKK